MAISPNRPLIDNNGIATQEMRSWIASMPIMGHGIPTQNAPEGVLYTDLDGTTGSRLYSSQGGGSWLLV